MGFFSKLFRKKRDYVVVPPGHKVVVIHPVDTPSLGRSESGYWIAQLGGGGQHESVLASLRELAARTEHANVIWIIQGSFLDVLDDWPSLLGSLKAIVNGSQGKLAHCVVFANLTSQQDDIMRQVKDIGMGVHYSAEDGACFVEVHKPSGIVVGFPGKPLVE